MSICASPQSRDFICGIIEGFYGRPWTVEQRKELFKRMNKLCLNAYMYAPKDDTKHRTYWRELYLKAEGDCLTKLIAHAKESNIDFYYALSPGLNITFSKTKDIDAIKKKMDQVASFGCNAFALLFDDIDSELSPSDKLKFKSFAHAQATITNEIYEHLGKPKFMFCPTEYCVCRAVPNVKSSEYLLTLGKTLDPEIAIMWTGPRVVSKRVTKSGLDELKSVLPRGNRLVLWDNIHANDYDPKRIYLGPFSGRDSDIICSYDKFSSSSSNHNEISSSTLNKVNSNGRFEMDYTDETAQNTNLNTFNAQNFGGPLDGVLSNPNCEFEANYVAIHTLAQWALSNHDFFSGDSCEKDGSRTLVDSKIKQKPRPFEICQPYSPRKALEISLRSWLIYVNSRTPYTVQIPRCVTTSTSSSSNYETTGVLDYYQLTSSSYHAVADSKTATTTTNKDANFSAFSSESGSTDSSKNASSISLLSDHNIDNKIIIDEVIDSDNMNDDENYSQSNRDFIFQSGSDDSSGSGRMRRKKHTPPARHNSFTDYQNEIARSNGHNKSRVRNKDLITYHSFMQRYRKCERSYYIIPSLHMQPVNSLVEKLKDESLSIVITGTSTLTSSTMAVPAAPASNDNNNLTNTILNNNIESSITRTLNSDTTFNTQPSDSSKNHEVERTDTQFLISSTADEAGTSDKNMQQQSTESEKMDFTVFNVNQMNEAQTSMQQPSAPSIPSNLPLSGLPNLRNEPLTPSSPVLNSATVTGASLTQSTSSGLVTVFANQTPTEGLECDMEFEREIKGTLDYYKAQTISDAVDQIAAATASTNNTHHHHHHHHHPLNTAASPEVGGGGGSVFDYDPSANTTTAVATDSEANFHQTLNNNNNNNEKNEITYSSISATSTTLINCDESNNNHQHHHHQQLSNEAVFKIHYETFEPMQIEPALPPPPNDTSYNNNNNNDDKAAVLSRDIVPASLSSQRRRQQQQSSKESQELKLGEAAAERSHRRNSCNTTANEEDQPMASMSDEPGDGEENKAEFDGSPRRRRRHNEHVGKKSDTQRKATPQLANDKKYIGTPSNHVEEIDLEDALLLSELFYLPFEHGHAGQALLDEFHWLKSHAITCLKPEMLSKENRPQNPPQNSEFSKKTFDSSNGSSAKESSCASQQQTQPKLRKWTSYFKSKKKDSLTMTTTTTSSDNSNPINKKNAAEKGNSIDDPDAATPADTSHTDPNEPCLTHPQIIPPRKLTPPNQQQEEESAGEMGGEAEWRRRAQTYVEGDCERVIRLCTKMTRVRNRAVLYEYFPYVWDLKGVLTLVRAFVTWLGLARFPMQPLTSAILNGSTFFSNTSTTYNNTASPDKASSSSNMADEALIHALLDEANKDTTKHGGSTSLKRMSDFRDQLYELLEEKYSWNAYYGKGFSIVAKSTYTTINNFAQGTTNASSATYNVNTYNAAAANLDMPISGADNSIPAVVDDTEYSTVTAAPAIVKADSGGNGKKPVSTNALKFSGGNFTSAIEDSSSALSDIKKAYTNGGGGEDDDNNSSDDKIEFIDSKPETASTNTTPVDSLNANNTIIDSGVMQIDENELPQQNHPMATEDSTGKLAIDRTEKPQDGAGGKLTLAAASSAVASCSSEDTTTSSKITTTTNTTKNNSTNEPPILRGGLQAEFHRMLPLDTCIDLFCHRPPYPPLRSTYNIRPYKPIDENSIYEITRQTFDDGRDATHWFSDCLNLPGDYLASPFLTLSPSTCFVLTRREYHHRFPDAPKHAPVQNFAVDYEERVCGYVLCAPDSKRFLDAYELSLLPELKDKYNSLDYDQSESQGGSYSIGSTAAGKDLHLRKKQSSSLLMPSGGNEETGTIPEIRNYSSLMDHEDSMMTAVEPVPEDAGLLRGVLNETNNSTPFTTTTKITSDDENSITDIPTFAQDVVRKKFLNYQRYLPPKLLQHYPSTLHFAFLPSVDDFGMPKRMLACLMSVIKLYGSTGLFVKVPLKNINEQDFYIKLLGFYELTMLEEYPPEALILGRAFY